MQYAWNTLKFHTSGNLCNLCKFLWTIVYMSTNEKCTVIFFFFKYMYLKSLQHIFKSLINKYNIIYFIQLPRFANTIKSKKTAAIMHNIHVFYYVFLTVCPGSSDPTWNIESNYFIQYNSRDLNLFCSVNEQYST